MEKTDTVLITGYSGFTGIHVTQSLKARGIRVVGISNEASNHNGTDIFYAPLEKKSAIQAVIKAVKPDYVLHLAAISFTNFDDALNYYKINVVGTENLLKSCLAEIPNVKRIILASSAAIYGDPKTDYIAESQTPNPISHYGCSKLSMEYIASGYMNHLPILITRPFNYTGPGQSPQFLVPKMVAHFRRREAVIKLGNTAITREFFDVRDAAEIYISLLAQQENGIVNLTSGIEHSFEDVLNTLIDITGHNIKLEVNPEFIRDNDIMRLVGNPAKLQQIINYKVKYSLRQTLSDMLS